MTSAAALDLARRIVKSVKPSACQLEIELAASLILVAVEREERRGAGATGTQVGEGIDIQTERRRT